MSGDEDISYLKLPIEEQCVHKLWKARKNGYEEAIKLFGQLDEKDPEWNKFTGIIKNFVIDSNAVAQEKGLEATLVFVENSATAGRTVGDIMTGLITRCYGAPKAKTKDIAIQISLMFIEIEKQDVVIGELVNGMDHKFPKIVSTCVKAATQIIKEFGPKVLNIKPLLKKLQSVLEDKDKNVRDEAKLLAIEISSWIGFMPVKVNIANLKPIQIQELETEFEKVNGNKLQPSRFLRLQQEQVVQMEEMNAGDGVEEHTDEVEDFEEHIDPVNILCQLNIHFYEKLESKKWQERKEAIIMLEGILSKALRLENGDYGDLVKTLKSIITKDTNVIIVGIAIKCIAILANRLKTQFQTFASTCIPVLLEKFKEKKQNVVVSLRDAVDAIYLHMTLESIHEDILTAINNKNPSVRAESISFLARCFTKCTPTILNKKMLKIFTTALIKTLNEADPTVRDNSVEALGTAWKVVSEKKILPFLSSVDDLKLAKIKEVAGIAIITAKKTTRPIEKSISASTNNAGKKESAENCKNTTIKINCTAVNTSKKIATNSNHKVLPTNTLPPIKNEREIGDDELIELASTFCPPKILSDMIDANWKIRLASVQEFFQIIDKIELPKISSQVLIKLLNKKPGIKDSNVQIQKLKLQCLQKVIEKFGITSTSIDCCIQDISSLLGDNKNGYLASQVLTTLAESARLDIVCNAVLKYAFNVQKNPKVQIDALNWLSSAILEFGFIIEPKFVMQNIKKSVSASNSQVRMAVVSLLGVMYLYMGPQLSLFFENESPTLLQQINAEFEKCKGKVPPKPIRGKDIKVSTESLDITSNDEKPEYEVNIRDIVPRVDLTSQITETLINGLSDKDWKVRSDALIKLKNIVIEARFINNDLGEVRKALQHRLRDSNARLCSNAINLVELISVAMGSSFKNYIKDYLPDILNALSDSKTFKCESARKCMNTWVDICGYREFFGGDILLDALKNNSVSLRTELWTWLADNLPLIPPKKIPTEELKCLLPALYSSLEDKKVNVRLASDKAVLGFMMHLGYASMYEACEKLRPISVKFCREKLDNERPNLPLESIQKPKVVKSNISKTSMVKPRVAKIPPTKANKENVSFHSNKDTEKNKENLDSEPLFQQNNLKHQRDIDEHKFKCLKWNFTTPREEFVEQLKEQMLTASINKILINYMFHPDFRHHIKGIDILSEDLNSADDNYLALISNLDLILKWMTLRFFDTNPSVLLKGLEYLKCLFDILIVKRYTLLDTEVSSFVPYLVTKLGDSKDVVRNTVRSILNQIAFISTVKKIFQYVIDGVKSKNSRQRSACLEHLELMINNFGTSVCQPNITVVCKYISKSIGDRDNSVRTAALNWFVAVFFMHGDDVFNLIGNIPEKDMGLLKERIKRASKSLAMPIPPTIHPITKMVVYPVQRAPQIEHIDNGDNNNATFNVSLESNKEFDVQRCLNYSRFSNTKNESISSIDEHSSTLEIESRSDDEIINIPNKRRFALDEKLIQELDAIVITKPKLVLIEYNWPIDHNNEVNLKKALDRSRSLLNNVNSKPCLNVSPFRTTIITPLTPVEHIQQLINQVTSQNINTFNTAITRLIEMLSIPNMRSKFLEEEKIIPLFDAIIKQFNIICLSHNTDNIVKYKKLLLNLCFSLNKHQELMSVLDERILYDLLTKLLYLLSVNGSDNSSNSQHIGKCLNIIIMDVIERSAHNPVACALLAMLYDTVKYPQHFSAHFNELLMKSIWVLIIKIPVRCDELCYNLVFARIHKFLEEFDSKYWKKQPSDIPLRTLKTVVYTLVQSNSDKAFKCLTGPKLTFPNDSDIFLYIHKILKNLNNKFKFERSGIHQKSY